MNKQEIIDWLETNKDERGIKIWERAGVKGMHSVGVGVTKLKALAKKAGKDHELALDLWNESIFECKTLSTLIDDPKKISRKQINQQVKDLHFWMLSHAYCNYLLPKYPAILELAEEWIESPDNLERRCGFLLFYQIAKNNKKLPDDYFFPILKHIENEIQNEENFVKDAMNNALWSIGTRNKTLNILSIEVAKFIGRIEVDYGDNSCEAVNVETQLTSERIQKKFDS
ncbi:MAG: DNA alkylation repair protein [Draconibacterium sp.]|nr:DNA alkylation repair protein [Draconibacterium sp.]